MQRFRSYVESVQLLRLVFQVFVTQALLAGLGAAICVHLILVSKWALPSNEFVWYSASAVMLVGINYWLERWRLVLVALRSLDDGQYQKMPSCLFFLWSGRVASAVIALSLVLVSEGAFGTGLVVMSFSSIVVGCSGIWFTRQLGHVCSLCALPRCSSEIRIWLYLSFISILCTTIGSLGVAVNESIWFTWLAVALMSQCVVAMYCGLAGLVLFRHNALMVHD